MRNLADTKHCLAKIRRKWSKWRNFSVLANKIKLSQPGAHDHHTLNYSCPFAFCYNKLKPLAMLTGEDWITIHLCLVYSRLHKQALFICLNTHLILLIRIRKRKRWISYNVMTLILFRENRLYLTLYNKKLVSWQTFYVATWLF